MLVGQIEETELIAAFAPLLPRGGATVLGPGDDAAVLRPGGDQVVTTDVLVEGRHFRTGWSTGQDVGYRAAMQNLADVAAMGARPTALVVALTLPSETPVDWVVDLAHGLAAACEPHGVGVVGGDLSGGPVRSVAVTALGDLAGAEPVLRSGARAGDVLALAGVAGHSAAGLALWQQAGEGAAVAAADAPGEVDPALAHRMRRSHLRPEPPLLAGLEASGRASAMLDVSDGLLRDAGRMGRASGVTLDLERDLLAPDAELLLPLAEELGVEVWPWVLAGGEDHGLLATFPSQVPLPPSFRRIGRVLPADPNHPVTVDGAPWRGRLGWDHFGQHFAQ